MNKERCEPLRRVLHREEAALSSSSTRAARAAVTSVFVRRGWTASAVPDATDDLDDVRDTWGLVLLLSFAAASGFCLNQRVILD